MGVGVIWEYGRRNVLLKSMFKVLLVLLYEHEQALKNDNTRNALKKVFLTLLIIAMVVSNTSSD